MASPNIVVGLDVGTTKVSVCVGQISEGLINILALAKVPNSGLRRGVVIDIEECVSAISGALEQAERIAGVQLDHAHISIGGTDIVATMSKGIIAVSRPDGEINSTDVERVIDAARTIALPPNKEVLHVIPRQFIVDGQDGIKDPVGMTGIRLETETLIIGAGLSSVKNLSKCVFQSGLQIDSVMFSPLASAKALLSKKQMENGVLLLDIGGGTTSLAIFEEGTLTHAAVLPIGSIHITNDIAIGLRISLDAAEKIKLAHGNASKEKIRKNETIDLSKFDSNEDQKIEKEMLGDIIEARLKEIFSFVKDELKSIGRDGMLPGGVILTGGGSQLENIADLIKKELSLSANLANSIIEFSGTVDKIDHPVYATSVGLMLYGFEGNTQTNSKQNMLRMPKNLTAVTDKVKDILKQFLP